MIDDNYDDDGDDFVSDFNLPGKFPINKLMYRP